MEPKMLNSWKCFSLIRTDGEKMHYLMKIFYVSFLWNKLIVDIYVEF